MRHALKYWELELRDRFMGLTNGVGLSDGLMQLSNVGLSEMVGLWG